MHKLSEHTGPNSVLHDIELDLLNFIEEWRQKGFDVYRFTLLRKAGQLKPAVLEKSVAAAKICLSRFLAKHNLTHRVITHKAQRDPRKVEVEALQFLDYICPRVADGSQHPDYIINMDQTPIPFLFHSNKTLEKKGTRTIHVCTSTTDTKQVTLAVTLEASWCMLPPLLIFKGSHKGQTASYELSS